MHAALQAAAIAPNCVNSDGKQTCSNSKLDGHISGFGLAMSLGQNLLSRHKPVITCVCADSASPSSC